MDLIPSSLAQVFSKGGGGCVRMDVMVAACLDVDITVVEYLPHGVIHSPW